MDPCHILLDNNKEVKPSRESMRNMFNTTFEKEIQSMLRFLTDIEFNTPNVDIVHRWWSEMIQHKISQKYNLTS